MSDSKYQVAKDNIINTLARQIDYKTYKNLYSKDFDTLQKLVDKATPKKIIYEDIGYDHYKNVNVYGCICPSCGLHIIEFTDDDVSTDSDDIETMFNSSMVHHGHQGLNNFCNRCSQAFDWSDEDER